MKNPSAVLCALMLFSIFALSSNAQQPATDVVSLQGVLTSLNGVPLPDGDYNGTLKWFDVFTEGQILGEPISLKLTQIHGAFTAELQAIDFPPNAADSPLYAEITVAQISIEPLKPRMRVGSVPLALRARSAPGMSPIGAVQLFAGSAASIPQNWLACDGRALSIAANAPLYAVIGTIWGNEDANGDGQPDFNIPDLRGVFVRGSGVRNTDLVRPLPEMSTNNGDDDAVAAALPSVTMMYIIRVR
ncbi:MAG: tail fiber protein [Ignavibacteria bacterium]|nr:tail fiber protein [Ignavibacteria bacterium]